MQYRHYAVDARNGLQVLKRMGLAAFFANTRDHGPLNTDDHVCPVIHLLDHPHYVANIVLSGMSLHYDNQFIEPLCGKF
jgi:hypothetical protein